MRTGWFRGALIVAGAALVVFPLLFAYSVGRPLSHDEHQHVAAGTLIAREGLMPYRDFPYLHTPYLPLIYSLFLGRCEYLLLATRVFSAVGAALIAGVLFLAAFHAFARQRPGWRLALSAAAVLLLLASPVFAFTIGRSSNHELSILFALLATVVHLAGIRAQRPLLFFFSGLLLALAIGTRVTFAPLVAPFAAVLFFFPRRSGAKELLVKIGALAAGGMLGALPMLWLFAEAPARFFFDVLQFSQTNIDYREATGNPQNMTWLLKLRFLFKEVIVPNFAVCAAAVVPIAILEWQRRRVRETFPVELAFLLLLLPFLLLGSLAPSPAFKQYFGALVPFLLLLGIFSGARLEVAVRWGKPFLLAGIAVLAAAVIGVWPDYQATLAKISTPAEWTPIKRHNEALKLRDYTQGTVLTLAPLFVLEANLKIVPEFVTGPFAWRVADFIPPTKRAELGIVGEQDLETFFAHHPPAAISLGREPRWESKLVEYAQRHGYRKVSIGDEGKALWLKPEK